MKGKIKLSYGLSTIKMDMFQSPRGIRIKDKRPDKVSIKFKGKDMSAVDFRNLIQYLEVLYSSMSGHENVE
ncbi:MULTISPECIES: hypothetical protein [Sphingobacterium]|uniref:hypothetical protein n=1 Tax=Sphingobacterium TaxID=28453 RepID=UPI00257E6912|nr:MULTISPECIES: hypothetical protein [Sphingobacterium]